MICSQSVHKLDSVVMLIKKIKDGEFYIKLPVFSVSSVLKTHKQITIQ